MRADCPRYKQDEKTKIQKRLPLAGTCDPGPALCAAHGADRGELLPLRFRDPAQLRRGAGERGIHEGARDPEAGTGHCDLRAIQNLSAPKPGIPAKVLELRAVHGSHYDPANRRFRFGGLRLLPKTLTAAAGDLLRLSGADLDAVSGDAGAELPDQQATGDL